MVSCGMNYIHTCIDYVTMVIIDYVTIIIIDYITIIIIYCVTMLSCKQYYIMQQNFGNTNQFLCNNQGTIKHIESTSI